MSRRKSFSFLSIWKIGQNFQSPKITTQNSNKYCAERGLRNPQAKAGISSRISSALAFILCVCVSKHLQCVWRKWTFWWHIDFSRSAYCISSQVNKINWQPVHVVYLHSAENVHGTKQQASARLSTCEFWYTFAMVCWCAQFLAIKTPHHSFPATVSALSASHGLTLLISANLTKLSQFFRKAIREFLCAVE